MLLPFGVCLHIKECSLVLTLFLTPFVFTELNNRVSTQETAGVKHFCHSDAGKNAETMNQQLSIMDTE